MTAKFTGRMTRRKRHVPSIATLSVIGLALLVSDGPECGCSSGCACSPVTPPSSFHQTAEKAERPLKSAESGSHSVNVSFEQADQAREVGSLLEIKDVKLKDGVAEGVAIYRRNGNRERNQCAGRFGGTLNCASYSRATPKKITYCTGTGVPRHTIGETRS